MGKTKGAVFVAFLGLVLAFTACRRTPGERTVVAHRVRQVRSTALAADLYRSASMTLNDAGTLYVAVPDRRAVAAYDTVGRVLYDIGSAGEGPGEFLSPSQVALMSGGHVLVFDGMTARLSSFDAGGRFLSSVRLVDSPWIACSDTLVFVVPGRKPNLFDVLGPSLNLIAAGGDDSFVAPHWRTGFSLIGSARRDTVWVLYASGRPPLLTKWLWNGTLLGETQVWPGSMARNVQMKETKMRAAVRDGALPGGGGWQHLTGLTIDRRCRAWAQYLSLTEDDSLRTVFFVYDSSLKFLCRVTGFAGITYSPIFDQSDRLWVIETPSKWRVGEGETAIDVYRVPDLFDGSKEAPGEL